MATRLALGERKKRVSLEITTTPRFAGASPRKGHDDSRQRQATRARQASGGAA